MHRIHKITIGLVSIVTLISMVVLAVIDAKQSYSVTDTTTATCPIINVLQSTAAQITFGTGVIPYEIQMPSTAQATRVLMYASVQNYPAPTGTVASSSVLIGQARPTNQTGLWRFVWDTSYWTKESSITYQKIERVIARAEMNGNTGITCESQSTTSPMIFTITSNLSATSIIALTSAQEGFNNYVNSEQNFSVAAVGAPVALSSTPNLDTSLPNTYGYFDWQLSDSTLGANYALNSTFLSDNAIRFKAGATAKTGSLYVKVQYGGATKLITLPIVINAEKVIAPATSTTTQPTTSNNTTTTTTPTQEENKTTTEEKTIATTTAELTTATQISSSQIQITEIIKTCITSAMTAERYAAISSGTRPTTAELATVSNCFANSKYIIPSSFSPVDAQKIDELPVEKNAVVNDIKNVTQKTDTTEKQTLKFTGKAEPNSTIVVYIFSDPIIITTKTDANGNWQYTLEDPLVPGKHEVYTVINKSDGSYKRSEPIAFVISTAAASSANPNGLNLTLAKTPVVSASKSNVSMIIYIVSTVAVSIFAIAGTFFVVKLVNKRKRTSSANLDEISHSMYGNFGNTSITQKSPTPTTYIPVKTIDQIETESDEVKQTDSTTATANITQNSETSDNNDTFTSGDNSQE